MKLEYLPTPGIGKKAGYGQAFAGIGKTIADLGKLGMDETKRQRDNKTEDMKLDFAKKANKRAEDSLQLSQNKFEFNKKEVDRLSKIANDEKENITLREDSAIKLFKLSHPNYTSGNYDRNDYLNLIKEVGLSVPKKGKITKLDVKVDKKDEKILTYEQDGNIYHKNLGPVKTDWNGKKSDIPEGYISVGKEFYEEYADRGMVKISKDGKFHAPIDFVNSMQKEQIGDGDEPLDTPL